MKRNNFLLVLILFITSISLTACGKPSPASLGIEKPTSGGSITIGISGLAVYGNAKINSTSKIASIEIETSKLSKIKTGYKVRLSIDQAVSYNAEVKSLPDTNAIGDSNTCTIEAALDADSNLDLSDSLEYTAMIKLPPKDGIWVVDCRCIEDGNDEKKYVWASRKKPEEMRPEEDNWELIEVKTGETDGKRIEVTEGLKDFKTVFARIRNW